MGAKLTKKVDEETIRKEVSEHPIVMYSKPHCGYCKMAKHLLTEEGIEYHEKDLDLAKALNPNGFQEYLNGLVYVTRQTTVPQIFICNKFIGGYTELNKLREAKQLLSLVKECADQFQ
ncbi:Glutaredoxin domain-containing protein [Aphelenchoides besseyi]|nr:Glutaredoxin domain-containing protein [Aphelenchoides besseyi]KAI6235879.1 Glutaredoxin domain-containing protein [Aphelenchoides besseyi]